MNLRYSANVGFLWEHLSLPDRITAAAKAGFDAVECHFPYEYPAEDIESVLLANNIPMIGLNTLLSPPDKSFFGVAAMMGKEELARDYIDQAIAYAAQLSASHVNVVAGAGPTTSEAVYIENLRYACKQASQVGLNIVIEPISPVAIPEYHFYRVEQAISIINAVAEPNLKLMLDIFHTQNAQGNLCTLLSTYQDYIGHIQISAVHDRGEPDEGEVNYPYILNMLYKNGYSGYIGAEYKPRGESVESGLGWLEKFREL